MSRNNLEYNGLAKVPQYEIYDRPGLLSARPTPLPSDPLVQMSLKERFAPDIVGHQVIGPETIAVVDKSDPHTLIDAMISVFGDERPVISFADATEKTRQTVLG